MPFPARAPQFSTASAVPYDCVWDSALIHTIRLIRKSVFQNQKKTINNADDFSEAHNQAYQQNRETSNLAEMRKQEEG